MSGSMAFAEHVQFLRHSWFEAPVLLEHSLHVHVLLLTACGRTSQNCGGSGFFGVGGCLVGGCVRVCDI